ncbi:hypothetical protein K449DRAFT_417867 [Hypoxylon sp. EC38]|nr:hypothetical protein K449DRAFT_417867 [Hypoxylon sp. EC38]
MEDKQGGKMFDGKDTTVSGGDYAPFTVNPSLNRDGQSDLGRQLRSIRNSCEDLSIEYPKQLSSLHDNLIRAIKAGNEQTNIVLSLLHSIQATSNTIPLQHRILRQLVFDDMHSRSDQIYEAQDDTCGWIFGYSSLTSLYEGLTQAFDDGSLLCQLEREKDLSESRRSETSQSFLAWLQNGQNILHISGNAGSGKSTLMKFLARHKRTREELQKWAGDKKLVLADFYFWNPGNKLQMTLQGLYRSILFEVLSSCPELTREVFPFQWRRLEETHGDPIVESTLFREDRIEKAFEVLVRKGRHAHYRFCLFIDGLDECDGNRLVHERLAQKLKAWTEGGDVKICASSRPYREFLKICASPETPTIYLHLLNQFDILVYCLNRFSSDHEVRETRLSYRELTDQIVKYSQGVFLWAHLVVDIILIGVRQGDPLNILQKKLGEIPMELDELYAKLREPIEKSELDKNRSNRILLFAIKNPLEYDLDAITYSWLDNLEDPGFPNINIAHTYSQEDASKRIRDVEKQINTLTRGFLELAPVADIKNFLQPGLCRPVRFSHRTARDFFLHSKTRMESLEASSKQFEGNHTYARLLLTELMYGFQELSESSGMGNFLRWLNQGFSLEDLHEFEDAIQRLEPDLLLSFTTELPSTYRLESYFTMYYVEPPLSTVPLEKETKHPHSLLAALQTKNWELAASTIERGVPLDHPVCITYRGVSITTTKTYEWPLWTVAAIFATRHQLSNRRYESGVNEITQRLYQHAMTSGMYNNFKIELVHKSPFSRLGTVSFGAIVDILGLVEEVRKGEKRDSRTMMQSPDMRIPDAIYNACIEGRLLLMWRVYWGNEVFGFQTYQVRDRKPSHTERVIESYLGIRSQNHSLVF